MNHHGHHPQWDALLDWLKALGMRTDNIRVMARSSPGAGFGLFAGDTVEPSTPLFSIPAKALMNSLTLAPHYPFSRPKLTCIQYVSMHLLLHRPLPPRSQSVDPLFGPYISVLPVDFAFHPFSWLWKEDKSSASEMETRLLNVMPSHILRKLNKMLGLFKIDWGRIEVYLRENPTVANRRLSTGHGIQEWEQDYLWAWLNVNTRCIYHRLGKTRTSPDNMTLCPILDFANHTWKEPFAYPRTTQAELWNTGPSTARKFGENFVLASPSSAAVKTGEQVCLRYGLHSNSTLFSEYGFVNFVDWKDVDDGFCAEVEVDDLIERLFEGRVEQGSWLKDVLAEEGYWGDWSMQSSPAPAHPSYRLISALRLYHAIPVATKEMPAQADQCHDFVEEWRNTIMGKQDVISANNEHLWRNTLRQLCGEVLENAEEMLVKVETVSQGITALDWQPSAKLCIETLWKEEIHVARAVMKSLEKNIDF